MTANEISQGGRSRMSVREARWRLLTEQPSDWADEKRAAEICAKEGDLHTRSMGEGVLARIRREGGA